MTFHCLFVALSLLLNGFRCAEWVRTSVLDQSTTHHSRRRCHWRRIPNAVAVLFSSCLDLRADRRVYSYKGVAILDGVLHPPSQTTKDWMGKYRKISRTFLEAGVWVSEGPGFSLFAVRSPLVGLNRRTFAIQQLPRSALTLLIVKRISGCVHV
jgi:hypothetical protein